MYGDCYSIHWKTEVHICQFYVNGNGEIKPGKSGIVLDLKEFDKLVELIPQIKESIERYELKDSEIPSSPFQLDLPVLDLDTVFLPSPPSQEPTSIPHKEKRSGNQPKYPSLPPSSTMPDVSSLMEPSLERILSDIRGGERKMTNDCDHKCPKAVGFSYPGVVLHFSECEAEKKKRITLENMDDNSPKEQKDKRKRANGSSKKGNKKSKIVKLECIDEVASVEAMKEVEKKLWLEHYNQLCEKLSEVIREKCTGCQTDEPNQLAHDLCLLAIFKKTVNPKDFTYKNRLRRWLIESPTIEV